MRTEMVIRMQASSEKDRANKAMEVAAAIHGVKSVTTLTGGDKRSLLLVVIGDGVDCYHLTSRLRRKVGHADVVQLRTLQDHGGGGSYYGPRGDYGHNYPAPSYAPAPDLADQYYHQQPSYEYYHPPPSAPPYGATVVHHEYYPGADDPNGCSIM